MCSGHTIVLLFLYVTLVQFVLHTIHYKLKIKKNALYLMQFQFDTRYIISPLEELI